MESKKELEYLNVLNAIESIPFSLGKKMLLDFLAGNEDNESIMRNRLSKKELFGCFSLYGKKEIEDMVENLLNNGIIEYRPLQENRFIKVISVTSKGQKELIEPTLHKKKLSNSFKISKTQITDEDLSMFNAFDFFLKRYNEEQKKAIVSPKSKILCIAGAGSGKTTVLTKRIEFLTVFRSVEPKNILAVTFTRKARTEMAARLSKSQYCNGVVIETFNSFCEKIVSKNENLIYNRKTRVISYSEKISLFRTALSENSIERNAAIDSYFSFGQRRDKTNEELLHSLMNDCYSIIEIYKMNNIDMNNLLEIAKESFNEDSANLEMVHKICTHIKKSMERLGLRDYSDQIVDCINFLKKNPNLIPKFDYVLVDEYQDVNSSQIELLDILGPKNLFCVGDPRQSIFAWRGSKIKYILNFEDKYSDCEIITLNTNYRSGSSIVELINKSIEALRLPDLVSYINSEAQIQLSNFESENDEMEYIAAKIMEINIPRNQIFVLARTNRLIAEISQRMKIKGIRHLVKTEESNRSEEASLDEITLATIHSIKGLEASVVFVMGCNSMNFPCKASDHPVLELAKFDDYDKEEEERRLFYVALSRAKDFLYLTYSGKNHTRFINDQMLHLMKRKNEAINIAPIYKKQESPSHLDVDVLSRLKSWRRELAQKLSVPPYIIMHDKTFLEIIEMNPLDVEDLRNISGIGPSKLEKYGKDIIDIIHGKV